MDKMATHVQRQKIYVACSIKECASTLQELLPDADIIGIPLDETGFYTEEDKTKLRQNAEILLAEELVIKDVIHSNMKLKWAQSLSVGVDSIMKGLVESKPYPNFILTRCGGVSARCMAEYVLGQVILLERHFYEQFQQQKLKNWKGYSAFGPCRSLTDLSIGILGGGRIGTAVGHLCKKAGMTVLTLTRTLRQNFEFDVNVTADRLCYLLENCDYICNVLPSTKDTKDLLSGDVLEWCQSKKPVFINIGRGNVIDEESLLNALKNNWISGAVLDVFITEPLPKESKLWTLPNVVITPHIGAAESPRPYVEHFVENYKKFSEGKELVDIVDWSRGY